MIMIKQVLSYLVMLGILLGLVFVVKHMLSRVTVASDYTEIEVPDVDRSPSYAVKAMALGEMQADEVVAYNLPKDRNGLGNGNGFAWIAGVPGDLISIAKGVLLVNNVPYTRCAAMPTRPDCPAFPVPVGHLFVVTSGHATDSIARGPLPQSLVIGVVESFP
jgi:hypothetical protein